MFREAGPQSRGDGSERECLQEAFSEPTRGHFYIASIDSHKVTTCQPLVEITVCIIYFQTLQRNFNLKKKDNFLEEIFHRYTEYGVPVLGPELKVKYTVGLLVGVS